MTAKNKFNAFIRQFPQYTDSAYELASPYLRTHQFKKGEHLLRHGSICRSIHFVTSGMFKIYYLRDGLEITTCFCKENRFTTSYQSLISRQASEMGIQAIEDSETVSIQYEDLNKLYAQHSFWQQIGRMVTEQEYISTTCYTRLINDKSAKQRYLDILNNEPELLQRVSLANLASYLQITPETISRIRKELSTS